MKLFGIFDNTRFRHCVYQTLKQLCDQNGTQKARTYYIIDWFGILYGIVRLLSIVFIVKNNFKIDPSIPYIIERDDPFMTFMKQHSDIYDEVIIFVFLFMAMFNFVCQIRLYKLNTSKRVWKLWYQILITNHDNYYRLLNPNYQTIVSRKANEIANKFRQNSFATFVPDFIIQRTALYYSKRLIRSNYEHVDEEKFFGKDSIHLPRLSKQLKMKLMNVLIYGDRIWFGFQLIIGKQNQNKKILVKCCN